MSNSENARTDEFVQLWTKHTRGLFAYIMTLVFDVTIAEDVLQETAAIAWRQFDSFESGTNFHAWTAQIAFNKSLSALKRNRRASSLGAAELAALSDESLRQAPEIDRQLEFLHACLQQLNERDRDLLHSRYSGKRDIATIAGELERTTSAVYKALERIHETLFTCVSKKLRQEARS
ncbi:sigma-70 family RNA polymerase sigma factor [Planctomicrobium sp. SH664]|uniref:sigma-70 family RNA polymerase sigma factor n=1 Tax=Planctomicrobium sp. SH664 TaxID=3448125 RepID=UPI003F5C4CFD